MAMAAGQSAAPILSLSDDLMLLLMKTAAETSGTLDVLRNFASARRRFQELAYGESSTLFEEPVFVSDRSPGAGRGDTILDVARLSARFGDRIQRLWLGNVDANVDFDPYMLRTLMPRSDVDYRIQVAAAGRARHTLLDVVKHCPNLTHLSLAPLSPRDRDSDRLVRVAVLGALEDLPPRFSLRRLRHLDLSGLTVPLPALRRLLRACSAPLERLYLRCTQVPKIDNLERPDICDPLEIFKRLNFPRLESLDVTGYWDPSQDELQRLVARLPVLRDLYTSRQRHTADGRPSLVIFGDLLSMDAASLRALRQHFEGRINLPRLAVPFLFQELRDPQRNLDGVWRLVAELGVPLLARLSGDGNRDPWTCPYFREAWEEGKRTLVSEWGERLAPLANEPLRSDRGGRRSPLAIAVERSPRLVGALLDIGANPLYKDTEGATALHVACGRGFLEGARALLEAAARAGLDLLAEKDAAGRTPLQLLEAAAAAAEEEERNDGEEEERERVSAQSDPKKAFYFSEQARRQRKLQREEARRGRSLIAAYAVEFLGLDGDQLEGLGVRRAFLEEAVWGRGGTEFLLHFAARECTPEAVRALLDAGADLWLEDEGGETVLQISVHARNLPLKGAIRGFAEENGIPLHRIVEGRPEKRVRAST
eukprot:tig00021742_g23314.t2